SSYFKAALLPDVDKLSVSQPSYVVAAAKVLDETPLDDLKAYLTLRALDARADVLPQAIRDAAFAFHGTALTGAKAERP
ncbi:hypothetical protein, partial [Klebsiella pneumoniae]